MKTIKKLLTILLIAFATVAGAQNNWYAPSVFHEKVSFKKEVSQTDGSDSLTLRTIGTNSTLNHGLGTLLLNNSKSAIGLFNGTGYRVAATATNIQLQQGATDSILINFSGDTAHVNATVNAWKFTPKLDANSVTGFWDTSGNAGTNPATNYIGTSDSAMFIIRAIPTVKTQMDTSVITSDSTSAQRITAYGIYKSTAPGGTKGFNVESSDGVTKWGYYNRENIGQTKEQNNLGVRDMTTQQKAVMGVFKSQSGTYAAFTRYDAPDSLFTHNLQVDADGCSLIFSDSVIGRVFVIYREAAALFGIFDDGRMFYGLNPANGYVLTSDADGYATWTNPSSIDYSSVPSYANNAAAFAVLGAGKLYYTDVAGEYILKVTH